MVDLMLCLGIRRNKRDDQSRSKDVERPNQFHEPNRIVDSYDVTSTNDADTMLVSDGHPSTLLRTSSSESEQSGQSAVASLRLTVSTVDGAVWIVDVDPEFTVDRMKQIALGHFQNPAETIKAAARYRLVAASSPEKQLNDEFTLVQEGVKNNDELILLKKSVSRQASSVGLSHESKDTTLKAPDEATIKQNTLYVPVKNADRVAKDTVTVVDFQMELRKTLVSLIDVAQKIQLYSENNLFTYIVPAQGDDNVAGLSKDLVDPSALKQLTDMGFSASKAKKALQQRQMSAVDALEQLLQQQGKTAEDIDKDELGHEDTGSSSETSVLDRSIKQSPLTESASDNIASSSSASSTCSPPPIPQTTTAASSLQRSLISLQQLLDTFRAYKRREFKPNMKAFYSLRDMGFDQDKIVDALRVSGNKHDAAFECLLSRWLTDDDLRLGLDVDGSVYKAIMANPTIQLGLNNPKVLYAFLHMLENPNCTNHWLNDPDTAPILNQIFKIYHLEKYSLQIKPTTVPEST